MWADGSEADDEHMIQNNLDVAKAMVIHHQKQIEKDAAVAHSAARRPRRWSLRRRAAAASASPATATATTTPTVTDTSAVANRPTNTPRPAVSFW
jgi:hypothetical protein